MNFKVSIRDGGGDFVNWLLVDVFFCNWIGVCCVDGVVMEFSFYDMNVLGVVLIGLGMKLIFFLGLFFLFGY